MVSQTVLNNVTSSESQKLPEIKNKFVSDSAPTQMAQVNISVIPGTAVNLLDKTKPLPVFRINGGKENSNAHTEDVELPSSDIELQLDDSGESAPKLGMNSATKTTTTKKSVELIDISSDAESERALSQVSTSDSNDIEVIKIVSANAKDSYDSDIEVISMMEKEGNGAKDTNAADNGAEISVLKIVGETVNVPKEETVEMSETDKVIDTTNENTSSAVTESKSSSTATPSETVPPYTQVNVMDTVPMETDVPTNRETKLEQPNVPYAEKPADELIQSKPVESSETISMEVTESSESASVEINETSISMTEIKIEQTNIELSCTEEGIPQSAPAVNSTENPTAENEAVVTNAAAAAAQDTNTIGEDTPAAEKATEETSAVETASDDTTPVSVVANSTEDTQLVENSTSVNDAENTTAVANDTTHLNDDWNSDAIDEKLAETANLIQEQFLARNDDNENSDVDLDFNETEVSTPPVQSAVAVSLGGLDTMPNQEVESISKVGVVNDESNVPEVPGGNGEKSAIHHMDTSGSVAEIDTVLGTAELMETNSSVTEVNKTVSSTVTVDRGAVEEADEVAQPSADEIQIAGATADNNSEVNFVQVELTINDESPSTESRKRKLSSATTIENSSVINELVPTPEKRSRLENDEQALSSANATPNVVMTSSTTTVTTEAKKKINQANVARKHTSSTNVSKTMIEMEKRIKKTIISRKRETTESKSGDDELSEERVTERNDQPISMVPEVDGDEYDFRETEKGSNKKSYSDRLKETENIAMKIILKKEAICKESIRDIFKKVSNKLSRRQLEEIITQKFCEMISDSSEIGELRRQVRDMQQTEFYRKQKILNLEKQIHQLKAVMHRYLEQVKDSKAENPASPIRITRSVGLQVAIDSTPHVAANEPSTSNRKPDDKLRNALTSSVTNAEMPKKVCDSNSSGSPSHPNPPSVFVNNKNSDSTSDTINKTIVSTLTNGNLTPRPILPKKSVVKRTEHDSAVIDLTDKDDKVDSTSSSLPVKNKLPNANGAVVAYPVKLTDNNKVPVQGALAEQVNKRLLKTGTHILVNGQLYALGNKPVSQASAQHPAPVPSTPVCVSQPGMKCLPPVPTLRINKSDAGACGIMLSWNMPMNQSHAAVVKYQLYAYQETNVPPTMDLWKIVGDVNALPLPMACTLTQFVEGFRYHFIVRAVDTHGRIGAFSRPESIFL